MAEAAAGRLVAAAAAGQQRRLTAAPLAAAPLAAWAAAPLAACHTDCTLPCEAEAGSHSPPCQGRRAAGSREGSLEDKHPEAEGTLAAEGTQAAVGPHKEEGTPPAAVEGRKEAPPVAPAVVAWPGLP